LVWFWKSFYQNASKNNQIKQLGSLLRYIFFRGAFKNITRRLNIANESKNKITKTRPVHMLPRSLTVTQRERETERERRNEAVVVEGGYSQFIDLDILAVPVDRATVRHGKVCDDTEENVGLQNTQ
jgi:hypothetical protein